MAILFLLALFSLGLTDIYRWIIDLRCHLQAFGRTHHWILSSNKSLDFGRCICIFIGDSTSSPSKLVFPSIFLFLGFYCPSSAHISSKEDLHVFLALTKSWKEDNSDVAPCIQHTMPALTFSGLSLVPNFWIF